MAAIDDRILVEDVSVRYRVPHERISSFKEYAIRRLQRRVVFEDFWALNGVTLAVRAGESLYPCWHTIGTEADRKLTR